MKREIKFRVYSKYEGMVIDTNIDQFISINPNGSLNNTGIPEPIVMQFTGLKDKNGKEIFEGDVVQYPADSGFNKQWDSFVGKICYNEDRPAFGVYGNDNEWVLTGAVEVIGNIYENPEL